jgi:hypothetical protein
VGGNKRSYESVTSRETLVTDGQNKTFSLLGERNIRMGEWKFRAAGPEDADAFAEWVTNNPQVEPKDLLATTQAANPTTVFFVIENDLGEVVMFAPVYCAAMLGYLGFNPESNAKERLKAMNMMKDGLMAFLVQFGIRELQTLTKPDYGVAKWALRHGFEAESRSLVRLDINTEMESAATN